MSSPFEQVQADREAERERLAANVAAVLAGISLEDLHTSEIERARVRFEAFMRENHRDVSLQRAEGLSMYADKRADMAWSAWLASPGIHALPPAEVRNLGATQRLELRPGDALAILVPGKITVDQRAMVRWLVAQELPGVPVLVFDGGTQIQVVAPTGRIGC